MGLGSFRPASRLIAGGEVLLDRKPEVSNSPLESSEVLQYLGLAPIDRPDKFAPQNALAVDDVGFGKFEGTVEIIALLLGIANGEQVDLVGLQKILVCALVNVDAYG